MTANEFADELEKAPTLWFKDDIAGKWIIEKLRQQQAEIKALKKSCLDEIFKRTYANQSAKVMEGYWQEAQAEIEALKLQLHTTLTNRDLRTYDGKTEMNNEPVAWIDPKELDMAVSTSVTKNKQFDGDIPLYRHPYKATPEEQESLLKNADYVIGVLREKIEELEKQFDGDIPLYTHPVKELTDEEIDIALYVADITLNNLSDGDISMERIKAFVRTILRKAQEK